tara:strand:- start:2029 stop:2259 length:231 start_codon:yes stop_codon:yes gene_type:complete
MPRAVVRLAVRAGRRRAADDGADYGTDNTAWRSVVRRATALARWTRRRAAHVFWRACGVDDDATLATKRADCATID